MAISQNAILAKCQLPKSLLVTLPTFFDEFVADNLVRGFLFRHPKTFWAQIQVICEIHIQFHIDSESFRQIH